MYKIYIIEDDKGIAEGISELAEAWNIKAMCAGNFRNIMSEFAEYSPHLVLIDISLPFLTVITGAVKSGKFQKFRLYLYLQRQIK